MSKLDLKLSNIASYHMLPKSTHPYRYMRFISMLYMVFLMAATVMAYKVVQIGQISTPGSTLIYTCTFFIGNIYAELYGESCTKKLIWESVILGYIFAVLITLVNSLPSPIYWNKYEAFNIVFGHILRFTNAGVVGYLLSAFLNAHLIVRWKHKLKGKYFWIRSICASSISEGVATFIAGFMTFFSLIPTPKIIFIMVNALLFKIAYGVIAVWPATFIVYILRERETR